MSTQEQKVKNISIGVPTDAVPVLHELAASVGYGGTDAGLAPLLQAAIKHYEWVVYQQYAGRFVTALSTEEIQCLEKNGYHHEDDTIERAFAEENAEKVRAYFEKAA